MLQTMTFTCIKSLVLAVALVAKAHAAGSGEYSFGMTDPFGPPNWGMVDIADNQCHVMSQSPINIESTQCTEFDDYVLTVSLRACPSNLMTQIVLLNVLPFVLYAYSNKFPNLANTGSDQILLSTNWTVTGNISRDVLEWFRAPDSLPTTQILDFLPTDDQELLDLINPNILELYLSGIAQNITEPCAEVSGLATDGSTDLLCQALSEASCVGCNTVSDISNTALLFRQRYVG